MKTKEIGHPELERILKDVGKDYCVSVLEPDALIRGIKVCVSFYEDAVKYHTNKYSAEQEKRLNLVVKTTKRLMLLLNDDVWQSIFRAETKTEQCLVAVRQICETSNRMLAENSDADGPINFYKDNYKKRSPFDWLVGHFLPLVYMHGGFAHIAGPKELVAHDSPYMRFAMATVRELGILVDGKPYARSTFIKAISGIFERRVRRASAQWSPDAYAGWRERLVLKAMKQNSSEM
jgi:hypothetical protein